MKGFYKNEDKTQGHSILAVWGDARVLSEDLTASLEICTAFWKNFWSPRISRVSFEAVRSRMFAFLQKYTRNLHDAPSTGLDCRVNSRATERGSLSLAKADRRVEQLK